MLHFFYFLIENNLETLLSRCKSEFALNLWIEEILFVVYPHPDFALSMILMVAMYLLSACEKGQRVEQR